MCPTQGKKVIIETVPEETKIFKSAILNTFKEFKKLMYKELKYENDVSANIE